MYMQCVWVCLGVSRACGHARLLRNLYLLPITIKPIINNAHLTDIAYFTSLRFVVIDILRANRIGVVTYLKKK